MSSIDTTSGTTVSPSATPNAETSVVPTSAETNVVPDQEGQKNPRNPRNLENKLYLFRIITI